MGLFSRREKPGSDMRNMVDLCGDDVDGIKKAVQTAIAQAAQTAGEKTGTVIVINNLTINVMQASGGGATIVVER